MDISLEISQGRLKIGDSLWVVEFNNRTPIGVKEWVFESEKGIAATFNNQGDKRHIITTHQNTAWFATFEEAKTKFFNLLHICLEENQRMREELETLQYWGCYR